MVSPLATKIKKSLKLYWNATIRKKYEADLINFLLYVAIAHHIDYDLGEHRPSFSSKALPSRNIIIINTNYYKAKELPFVIGHEIAHIIHQDDIAICTDPNAKRPCEHTANVYSVDLIHAYAKIYGRNNFVTPTAFLSYYDIPDKMYKYSTNFFNY